MLCATCISMFQIEAKNGDHHKTLDDLIKAAESGCRICIYQMRHRDEPQINTNTDEPYWRVCFDSEVLWVGSGGIFVHVSHAVPPPPKYLRFLELATDDLEAEPWRVRQEHLSLRDIPQNTGHETVAEIAKTWLKRCRETHSSSCEEIYAKRDRSWYPKRLIEVGDGHRQPRIIQCDLHKSIGGYATLSHCWGSEPSFTTLTSENIKAFSMRLPLDNLPQSFRDAVIICRRLGIRHLWIDSLCILQSGEGSGEDWLSQASEMHAVYLNCELNLSINHAQNPAAGAFVQRNPSFLHNCYVWTALSMEELDTKSCRDDFSGLRRHQPLFKRGWVFQERLLSRRTLHFDKGRIAWDCQESRGLSEYLFEGLPCGCHFNVFEQFGLDPYAEVYRSFNSVEAQLTITEYWWALIE
ncbi:HET-domain-containing protein [Cadophora sp. DSE1049]|nr:HET-domain-containing protein [Cadophora sp. DSE1049]